jgi:hypothetical protein
MKLKVVFFGMSLMTAILPQAFSGFDGYVTLSAASGGDLASTANVSYTFDVVTCTNCTYQMIGDHKIQESNGGGVVTQRQWGVYGTQYRNTLSTSGAPGSCYFATNNASLTGQPPDAWAPSVPLGSGGPWQSSSACIPSPPPPPDGGGGCDGGRVLNIADDCSPIVINFESGDYRLTGRNSPVLFDMPGNGHPVLMGWTAAGADEAFLWLDRNHNGKVTSGAELFGNFTPLQNGRLAINGFEALAEYDANHDGIIDDRDPIWSRLMLWRDLNHNGLSEPSEISPLDASDVTAIDLHDHWTGRHDPWGNAFRYESLISIRNRSGRAVRKQPVYDIFFVSVSQ